ncbi:MAG: GTP 3',8-cyclase MoaA [Planctomycetes bacterium]|nr:GTP 3',8-cyclase MoaA [Planctomycetota bacterium]
MPHEPLTDSQGRRIEYVRLSITDRCDYRCQFCMPDRAAAPEPVREPIATGDILRLARILAAMDVSSFKVTGGEPFMNPDALAILTGLKATPGVASVTVTTNGSTLSRHAEALSGIGVDSVNISLNAVDPDRYCAVTRTGRDVAAVLRDVVDLKRRGVTVKLNMVPIRGLNDADIVPVVEFALEHDIPVRFIELMPLGEGRRFTGLGRDEVMAIIAGRFGPLEPAPGRYGNGPALYSRIRGRDTRIGYIAALSGNFCADCNRIRLTSRGFLKTCLHHGHGADLAGPLRDGADDAALAERIRRIVRDKPSGHQFDCPVTSVGGGEPMNRIGG